MTTPIVKIEPKKRIIQFLWIISLSILFAYGFLAMNAGLKLSDTYSDPQADQAALQIRNQADHNETINHDVTSEILPLWLNLSAKFGTDQFVYGSDGAMDSFIYYFQMSRLDKFVLSGHMMLGMIIMIFGALQFWPTFRKKYPKIHRYIGATYLIAAFSSMALSVHHLIVTGPDNTFGGFAFYVGLWLLAISATGALLASIYYIKKKDILRHMGWQTVAFGFFLTAPLQRVNWIILPYFFSGQTSFNEMNYLVNVILLIEASLVGYLIFFINRNSINSEASVILPSPKHMQHNTSTTLKVITISLAVFALGIFAYFNVFAPGFENHHTTQTLFPKTLVAADQSIHLNTTLNIAFAFLSCCLVTLIVFWFVQPLAFMKRNMGFALVGLSLVLATILWYWATIIGLPNHAVSAGGTFFALIGSLMALFSLLSLWAMNSGRYYLFNEFLFFLLAAAIAIPMVYVSAFVINSIGLVPDRFIDLGHGYQIAVIGAIFPSILIAIVHSIYSTPSKKPT